MSEPLNKKKKTVAIRDSEVVSEGVITAKPRVERKDESLMDEGIGMKKGADTDIKNPKKEMQCIE